MDLTKEALQYAIESVMQAPCKMVMETHDKIVFVINAGTGNAKTIEIKKDVPLRNHVFKSIPGFVDYLNSDHCNSDYGVIFVGHEVTAHMQYQKPGTHLATINMDWSEEFAALLELKDGISQKGLWRLLITTLHGCIDPSLCLQISQIKVASKSSGERKINDVGVSETAVSGGVAITFADPQGNGTQTAKIGTSWTWEGRIWECDEAKYKIQLTLEIDTDDGLHFVFHPERMETTLTEARLALAERLRREVNADRFTVHEGTY